MWIYSIIKFHARIFYTLKMISFLYKYVKYLSRPLLISSCSFSFQNIRAVLTGNWGSGAFHGNVQLKAMIQWIAASCAGAPSIIYCPYTNPLLSEVRYICYYWITHYQSKNKALFWGSPEFGHSISSVSMSFNEEDILHNN